MPADIDISGKATAAPCIGLASDAPHDAPSVRILPDDQHAAVSTNNVPLHNGQEVGSEPVVEGQAQGRQWYALRTTYGRERQAYEYIVSHGGTAYWPTMEEYRMLNGRRKALRVSRIPNMLFAYGTQTELQTFVYDNVNLPFLRFYYGVHRIGNALVRRPLVVPERQMESLRIICEVDDGNVALIPQQETRFQCAQLVRITHGRFAGVVGRVARYHGQQRVAVMVEGLFCIATAYVPSAFLEAIPE